MTASVPVRAIVSWTEGLFFRDSYLDKIRYFLDVQDVDYDVHKYGGWLEATYRVVITGPDAEACGRAIHKVMAAE